MSLVNDIIADQNNFLELLKESSVKISSLKTNDNISRRNILKEIHNVVQSGKKHLQNLNPDLENLISLLITTLACDNEKCREIAATILILIFKTQVSHSSLKQLFNILSQRLGKTDEREKSEEVRLLEINIILCVIEGFNDDLLPHFNQLSNILSVCIIDDCPDIKRSSCECLFSLSFKQKKNFHMIASNFLSSLLQTISHQHLKTRALCVQALGSLMNFLKENEFDQAIRHLSQRLFDRSPQVRMAVTIVIGELLLNLDDRYSYFPRLIPLMLSSMYDDVPDIQSKAISFWCNAGAQYLRENEKDYKDLIDFPKPDPEDYPNPGERPSLGCRILVHRNIYNILPPLLHDIADWVTETKVKSSKVLYSLILHSEEKITIHLVSTLQGIESAAKCEEKECVNQALNSAELLGYFTDPNLLFDSILTLVHKTCSASNIGILAACLRGCRKPLPDLCFIELTKFISSPTISRLRQAPEQANVLICIDAILNVENTLNQDSLHHLFIALVSICGLATKNIILEKAKGIYKNFVEKQQLTEESLYKMCAHPFMKSLVENNELWTPLSPEMPIFSFLIEMGHLDGDFSEFLMPVFVNNLHPSKDAKLRSKILTLLAPVFKSISQSNYQKLSEPIIKVIGSGIFPNLQWAAGKTASSLRSIAAASLYEIFLGCSCRNDILKSLGGDLLPILSTLSDDDATTTRLLSCKILELLLPNLKDNVDEHKIHTTSFEIMHCLDDESDDVRIATLMVLKEYIKSFPVNYDWKIYRSYLKSLYENVLIHMDDNNEKIKFCALNFLKESAFAAPDLLNEELESKRYDMASDDMCAELTEHIKTLKF